MIHTQATSNKEGNMESLDEMVTVNGVRYRPEDAPKTIQRETVNTDPEHDELEDSEASVTDEGEDEELEKKVASRVANKARTSTRSK